MINKIFKTALGGILVVSILTGCGSTNDGIAINENSETEIEQTENDVHQETKLEDENNEPIDNLDQELIYTEQSYLLDNNYIALDIEIPSISGIESKIGENVLNTQISKIIKTRIDLLNHYSSISYKNDDEHQKLSYKSDPIDYYSDDHVVSFKYLIKTIDENTNILLKGFTYNRKNGRKVLLEDIVSKKGLDTIYSDASKSIQKTNDTTNFKPARIDSYYFTSDHLVLVYDKYKSFIDSDERYVEVVLDKQEYSNFFNYEIVSNEYAYDYDFDSLVLDKEHYNAVAEYPIFVGEKEAVVNLNKYLGSSINDFVSNHEAEALKMYQESKKENYEMLTWNTNVITNVHRNTEHVISLETTFHYYTGDKHGQYYIEGKTYDGLLNKFITLSELFEEDYEYKAVINDEIRNQLSQSGNDVMLSNFKGIEDDQEFYLTDDSLVIIFQAYAIGPYEVGAPSFEIKLSSLETRY